MNAKPILIFFTVLALVTMACGVSINLPVDRIQTGVTQVDQLSVPVPANTPADLTIAFAAGDIELDPGAAAGTLVEGTVTYNVQDLKPEITTIGNNVKVATADLDIHGIPSINLDNVKNEWDLRLGDAPTDLKINAGAYMGDFELGGLSLTSLEVTDGAADVRLSFGQPNKVEMDRLRYKTGASSVELRGLANANFSDMNFESGAGDYTLDFSGLLQRDALVVVKSGISQVTIIVPEGVSAVVEFKGGLASIDPRGGWQKSGNTYTLEGAGPTLTIEVDMGAGSLVLKTQ